MSTHVLSPAAIAAYWANGYAFVENALTPEQRDALVRDFAAWVEESRQHRQPYGRTLDHRPRFDLEIDHSAERPALRRVASPVEISDAYLDVMRNNRALDAVAQLIGPNIAFFSQQAKAGEASM